MDLLTVILWITVFVLCFYVVWGLFFTDSDVILALAELIGRPVAKVKGQVVWVTGASSGLGEALAYQLASNGAKLVLSARTEKKLREVKERCLEIGNLKDQDILVVPFDISDTKSHEKHVKEVIDHFKKIDILINNAGRYQIGRLAETDLQVDRDLFDTNYFGTISLTKVVLRHFLEMKKGHFVVVSSVCAKWGFPTSAPYVATKHALLGYFDSLRTEHISDNITVTQVCPGIFSSDIFNRTLAVKSGESFGVSHGYDDYAQMTSERCAHLTLVAAVNKLNEAWMANQPLLVMTVVAQYMPTFFKSTIIPLVYTKKRISIIEKGGWPKEMPSWKPLLHS